MYRVIDPLHPFTTSSGAIAAGGTLTFYEIGTSTLKNTYNSNAGTTANPNPITINGSGYPAASLLGSRIDVWGSGSYRVLYTPPTGSAVDVDPITDPSASVHSVTTIAALRALTSATFDGTYVDVQYHTSALGGGGGRFVRNGSEAAVTRTCSTTSGSKIVTITSGALTGLVPGMAITGTGVPAGARFEIRYSVASSSFLLSSAATATGSATLTFSLDNNGTIIIDASGRRWDRVTDDAVAGVRWFGAVPGSTAYADTNRLAANSAMWWLDSKGGGSIDLGGFGVYYWNPQGGQLDCPHLFDACNLVNGVEFAGSGPATIWKLNAQFFVDNPVGNPDVDMVVAIDSENLTFRDFQFDGSALELNQAVQTTLSSGCVAGDTVINVVDASLLRANHELAIQGNSSTSARKTISSIAGNAVTLTATVGITGSAGNIVHRYFNEQMHGIRLDARAVRGRTAGAVKHVRVQRVWWTNVRGDAVFGIGESTGLVSDVRISDCVHIGPYVDATYITRTAGRSGTAWQRNVEYISITHNYAYGITDAFIDAEASGASPHLPGMDFDISNNFVVHLNSSLCVSPGGLDAVSPMQRLNVSNNSIYGGGIRLNDTKEAVVNSNFCYGGTTEAPLYSINFSDGFTAAYNVLIDARTAITDSGGLSAKGVQSTGQKATRCTFLYNYISTATSGNQAITVENPGNYQRIIGNLGDSTPANSVSGIKLITKTPETGTRTGGLIAHNIMRNYVRCLQLTTYNSDDAPLAGYSIIGNTSLGSVEIVRLDCSAGTAVPFPSLLIALNNGDATNIATGPSINDQTSGRQTFYMVGGNQAGHGARYVCTTSPNGIITAPIGSQAIFKTGTVSTGITFEKRTSTGNTGWVPLGGYRGSATFNPGSIASGAVATTTVTVTGAAAGDLAVASHSTGLAEYVYPAVITSTDTATVTPANVSNSATTNPGSGTLRVRSFPQ